MEPEDAAGLSACIKRCYGDSYPKRIMYDPAALAEKVQQRGYNGVVAVADGSVIGHIGFSWPDPRATAVEAGTTVVDPDYRGGGLMRRLSELLRHNIVADGAYGFIHFPTTAHAVMQKASLRSGGCETGIMLAYLPPEARDLEIGGSGEDRLAVTVVYEPLSEAPVRAVYLPERYADLIAGFADHLRLERRSAGPSVIPAGPTAIRSISEAYRKLERWSVDHIGDDFDVAVQSRLAAGDARLIHVDLGMDQPALNLAVEVLKATGFAFAAWMPGWGQSDVLRLQILKQSSQGELHPSLESPAANALAALIRSELH